MSNRVAFKIVFRPQATWLKLSTLVENQADHVDLNKIHRVPFEQRVPIFFNLTLSSPTKLKKLNNQHECAHSALKELLKCQMINHLLCIPKLGKYLKNLENR